MYTVKFLYNFTNSDAHCKAVSCSSIHSDVHCKVFLCSFKQSDVYCTSDTVQLHKNSDAQMLYCYRRTYCNAVPITTAPS